MVGLEEEGIDAGDDAQLLALLQETLGMAQGAEVAASIPPSQRKTVRIGNQNFVVIYRCSS